VYIHVPEEKRTKVEPPNIRVCGIQRDCKGLHDFHSTQQRTIMTQAVKFEENLASRKPHETLLMIKDE